MKKYNSETKIYTATDKEYKLGIELPNINLYNKTMSTKNTIPALVEKTIMDSIIQEKDNEIHKLRIELRYSIKMWNPGISDKEMETIINGCKNR